MHRYASLMLLVAAGLVLGQAPQSSRRPSGPRPLAPAEQAQIDELQKKIKGTRKTSDQLAWQRELVELRSRLQGPGHWETTDARLEAEHLEKVERVMKLPPEQWRAVMIDRLEIAKLQQQALNLKAGAAEAQRVYRQLLERLRGNQLAKPQEISQALDDLAHCLHELERYQEAESLFAEGLAFREKLQGATHPDVGRAHRRLALPLFKQGRVQEARLQLQRGLAIHLAALGPDHPETVLYLNNLALAFSEEGDLAAAETAVLEGLAIAQRSTGANSRETAALRDTQGTLLLSQGRLAEAEATFREVLTLYTKLKAPPVHVALTLNNLAYCLKERSQREADPLQGPEQLREAEKAYARALEILDQAGLADGADAATIGQNLACLWQSQGKWAQSAARHRQLLARLQDQGTPAALAAVTNNLAHCEHELGHFAAAEKLVRETLTSLEPRLGPHHELVVTLRYNLATNLASQGRFDGAEGVYLACAEDYEILRGRRASTGLERSEGMRFAPYQALAGLAARRGDSTAAFDFLERGLGRGCLEDGSRLLAEDERQRLRHLEKHLAELDVRLMRAAGPAVKEAIGQGELAPLRAAHVEALRALKGYRQELNAKHGPAGGLGLPLPWRQIQQALPQDTALVAWVDEPGSHWACVLRAAGDPTWINLAKDDPRGEWTTDQAELPGKLREAVRDRQRVDVEALREDLIEQRVKPLLPHLEARADLPKARQVVITAPGDLLGIPPALLFDSHAVCTVPSGSLFALLRQRPTARQPARFLVLGDVAYPEGSRLPYSRGECLDISRQVEARFGPGSVATLLGADATAERLRGYCAQPQPAPFRLLHLCSHGQAGSARAWDAALLFPFQPAGTAGRPARSQLTASEVLHSWNLDADLVTLSACNSGLGKHVAGEGFVGFAQALLLSGSRGVLVSQWPVSDRATALLMCRFYENLLGAKNLSKAEALGEAQQWLRGLTGSAARQLLAARAQAAGLQPDEAQLPPANDDCPYAHPYYWAGFTLVGTP